MGCGGSRADAIEPRYYESWTRETESTWLTNTDTDLQLSATATATGLSPGEPDSGPEAGGLRDQGSLYTGMLEDGLSTQTCVPLSSSANGIMNSEKTTTCGIQCTTTTTTPRP
ncbi:brain and acute leukemia cytoplasmic protein isoform X1 [Gracilinanus agilis]|uniref:brain and acute leukemia cytoplasmic protein isoform X1 n=1 Tax=Gracilinanus agilis TaxID=191870 RepID=UPI001CFE9EFB|nr:brain and acute leukemia cytoplasmic protein isoform X1 [Gracilinanus agilis]XP_044524667.1 brain and acute leukemia cytoplasmic protein isoform X1 [Gracilinanus agilis]